MAGMREQFKMDEHGEQEGAMFVYGNFRVRLARAGGTNKKYARVLERETRPLRRAIQSEMLSDEQAREIMKKVFAETIVLSWETLNEDGQWESGIEDEDGVLIPFTKENVLAIFTELPELFAEIQDQATKANNYRRVMLEEDSKN